MLEMYATHLNGNEELFLRSRFSMATDLAEKYSRYDHLVSHVYVTAPSLQKVKRPRGWWNRPKIELLSVAERERDLNLTRCAVPTGHSLAPTLDRLQTSATSPSSKRSSPIPPQSLRPIGIQRRSPTPALRFRLPLLTSRCMERITVCSLGCKTSSIIVVHIFRVCGQSHYSARSPWTRS
jgi:hypothetical protein